MERNESTPLAVIVIPSRFGSTRFPGKPLATIAGKSLLKRVWSLASALGPKVSVIVATDDQRIKEHAESFGATAVMTASTHINGSERVAEVVSKLSWLPKVVINLQGDALLTPPWIIEQLISEMLNDSKVGIATPAVQLTQAKYQKMMKSKQNGISSGTTVTFNKAMNALYFSKSVIPYRRSRNDDQVPDSLIPVYQHIGMYGYTPEALKALVALPEGEFERVEQLEQLRALEHGMPIRVVKVDLKDRTMWPIDAPEDVQLVEEIIATEGELL